VREREGGAGGRKKGGWDCNALDRVAKRLWQRLGQSRGSRLIVSTTNLSPPVILGFLTSVAGTGSCQWQRRRVRRVRVRLVRPLA